MSVQGTDRKEQKRQQILNAASELFCQQGYGISMDAIAQYANVSKQTVYAHFSNKDQLFETCIIEKCKNAGLDWDLERDERAPHVCCVNMAGCSNLCCWGTKREARFKNTVRQSDSHPELARIFLEQGPKRNVSQLGRYLQKLVNQGDMPFCEDVESAAMQMLLMLHG
ncbi:TetR/AcrR family transcriptional regulator, partial [Enterovibrio sp. Hal110]